MVCETTDDEDSEEDPEVLMLVHEEHPLQTVGDGKQSAVPWMAMQATMPVLQQSVAPLDDRSRVVLPVQSIKKIVRDSSPVYERQYIDEQPTWAWTQAMVGAIEGFQRTVGVEALWRGRIDDEHWMGVMVEGALGNDDHYGRQEKVTVGGASYLTDAGLVVIRRMYEATKGEIRKRMTRRYEQLWTMATSDLRLVCSEWSEIVV